MGFRRYHIVLATLVTMLVISAIALGWALSSSRIHLAVVLAIVLMVCGILLYQQLSRSNRDILFFFRALENDDTSIKYSSRHRNKFIEELHQNLNRVNESFQELKFDNERREQYFRQILEQLSSGLLVISSTGHINQVNEEALRLLNLPNLTHMKALSNSHPGLHGKLLGMNSLDRTEITVRDGESGLKRVLGMQVVEITLGGEEVRVITIHDLSAGMERKEIDDWIRLIRVMSHEIMNSLAPITSISTTLKEVWAEHESGSVDKVPTEAAIHQTLKGLDAIAEQSEGLTTFFESYRVLSRIPDPIRKEFSVCELYARLETLISHYREDKRLRLSIDCDDPGMTMQADEQMITQVMLNLIKNAVQAVESQEKGEIMVTAQQIENRIILKVTDNGEGIPPEVSDEIFMPFFTTRQKGTGVGLSYSRQVLAMNGGRIEFDSQPGRTQFRILL